MTKETIHAYKKHFLDGCINYRIPMQNKSILCYALADKLIEQPGNEELRNLLIAAVSDDNFLISHFSEQASEKKSKAAYKKLQKKINKLTKKIDLQKSLKEQWEHISSYKTLPTYETFLEFSSDYEEETEHLCFLFRKCFKISEKNSPELYANLHHFVCITRANEEFRDIAPFFFYQLMTKYTKQLATSSESFSVYPKQLWEIQLYKFEKDSDSDYETYYQLGWLFRKLCKYYKKLEYPNLALCRYAFETSSNLIQWLLREDEEHAKKYLSPCHYALHKLPVFYWEMDEPSDFDIYEMFSVNTDADDYYFNELYEEHEHFDTIIRTYIIKEHVEYIIQFMYAMYLDAGRVKNLLLEIYNNCIAKEKRSKEIPKESMLVQIFEILTDCMDIAVTTKVGGALG